jgi:hypothetical protein
MTHIIQQQIEALKRLRQSAEAAFASKERLVSMLTKEGLLCR